MNNKSILRIVLSLVVIVVFTSCSEKKAETKVDEKVKIKVQKVNQIPVRQLAVFTANVEGDVVNQITPALPMRIKKIYVDVGSKVSQGQRLVDMDNSNLQQQQVQLETLERDYKRYEELLKVGGISQQQVDQMKAQLDVTETAVRNIKENTSLISPINGIITARNYDDGDVFASMPILTVQQLNPVKAVIHVSESYFPKVKQGMKVDVRLDTYPDEVFEGKIKLIYPTIDANMHTFTCEVEIPNKDMRVRPGMFARVTLNFGEISRVVVQDASVVKQSGSNDYFVFSVVNGKAVYNAVQLGQRLADKWEIISGINPGDVIVTSGQTKLVDGTAVEIVE